MTEAEVGMMCFKDGQGAMSQEYMQAKSIEGGKHKGMDSP